MNACGSGLRDPCIKSSCRAYIRSVISMIRSMQGDAAEAKKELGTSLALIAESEGKDFIKGSSIPAVWFDWVIAGILSREEETAFPDG